MIYPLKWWSGYGYRFGQRTWYGVRHVGVDFIVPVMTPVYASMDGTINRYKRYQGGLQIWQYGSGKRVRYMHLSAFAVGKDQYVKEGTLIAWSGNTGAFTTGPHLHFDLQINGKWVNPLLYLKRPQPKPQSNDILIQINMTYGELLKDLAKDGFVKKDERFTFYPNGKPAIVNHGKQYFPNLGDMAIVYMKLARPIREVEKGYPVTTNRKDVLS